jgi:hypothetical protein
LGSAELGIIAQGPTLSAASAEQPGYVQARLLAAEGASDAAVRARLLEGVLATDPDASEGDPRLGIFNDARAAGDHHRALTAIEPLFTGTSFDYLMQQTPSAFDEQSSEPHVDEWMAGQFLTGRVEQSRKAQIAADLADSLASLGRLSPAATMLAVSLRLEPNAERQQRADSIHAELARRAENARRRPAVREALEQPNPVHPKLEARP